MTAEIIDGKKIAAEIQAELKQRISKLGEKGVTPETGNPAGRGRPGLLVLPAWYHPHLRRSWRNN